VNQLFSSIVRGTRRLLGSMFGPANVYKSDGEASKGNDQARDTGGIAKKIIS
jgi:hypothetical protein